MKNYNNPIQAGLLNGPHSSGMKIWVTPTGKEPQAAGVLAEGKGNKEFCLKATT